MGHGSRNNVTVFSCVSNLLTTEVPIHRYDGCSMLDCYLQGFEAVTIIAVVSLKGGMLR